MRNAIKKLYYSITEISQMIGEEQHVLRYWEREFTQLRPQKNRAGNRVYAQRDLAVLFVIKRLLRQERYTVAGAKELLRQQTITELAETAMAPYDGVENAETEASTSVVREVAEAEAEARAIAEELASIAATLRAAAARM
jgi:DNA-binding transcriptional MerR regulator